MKMTQEKQAEVFFYESNTFKKIFYLLGLLIVLMMLPYGNVLYIGAITAILYILFFFFRNKIVANFILYFIPIFIFLSFVFFNKTIDANLHFSFPDFLTYLFFFKN